MSAMMQTFHWDCPRKDKKEFQWWKYINEKIPEFDQRGTMPTWFGSRQELNQLIETAHKHQLSVIADIVINHNSGADSQEVNPITSQSRWTKFNPKSGYTVYARKS